MILPHRFGTWESGGGHHRIVQTPDAVTIYYEYGPHGGAYRTIPLDGRPHLPPHIRQWLGDARGRWEGDTLVVETRNFTDKTNYEGARDNLRLTERFTLAGADFLLYHVTIEDDTVFTRPWTMEIPMTLQDARENRIYEAACHEGNYGLTGILAGARVEEGGGRQVAAGRPTGTEPCSSGRRRRFGLPRSRTSGNTGQPPAAPRGAPGAARRAAGAR